MPCESGSGERDAAVEILVEIVNPRDPAQLLLGRREADLFADLARMPVVGSGQKVVWARGCVFENA
jgi:hypothetical protein